MLHLRTLILFSLCMGTLTASGADWTWTGAASSDWSNKLNWTTPSVDPIPQPGDTVILAGGAAKPSNQNIPSLSIFKITIPLNIQPATVVSGLSITLGAGGLDFQNAAADFAFATQFVLAAQQRWSISANRTLTLTGSVSATLPDLDVVGSTSAGNKFVSGIASTVGVEVGMPVESFITPDTWVTQVNSNSLALTLPSLFTSTGNVGLKRCWIIDGAGVLDLSAMNGSDLNAPLLAYAGTVRFGTTTLFKSGVILGRTAALELKSGSGFVTLTKPVVSLGELNADRTEPESPTLIVHAGDTLQIPSAPGVALSLEGAGTQNAFRMPGAGHVRFIQTGQVPESASGSLRMEGGTTSLNSLSLQSVSASAAENGCVEFFGTASINVLANSLVAVTAANGSVIPQISPANSFNLRYGPRQLSAFSGVANMNISAGAVFQNNLHPVDNWVLAGSGATLNVMGADDTSIFRLGRNGTDGAVSTTLNLGRFDLKGGQFYIHASPLNPPFGVFPSQAGFTLALNGGVFNGNHCDDFQGNFVVYDAPAGQARIDNFKLVGSGAIRWGAGVLEKINVVDDPLGHGSSQEQHTVTFSRVGSPVSVTAGANLRISAGTVVAEGSNPFADDTVPLRYVAIENNANFILKGIDMVFGSLSGSHVGATLRLEAASSTTYSESDSEYAGKLDASGGFVKAGSGALRLTGESTTYQGAIRIDGGTLIADNSVSATGTQEVTVAAGGTLAGAGKIVGGVILNGALHPGRVPFVAGDNTLETGSLTLNVPSVLRFTLTGSPATGDTIAVDGNVTVNGGELRIANGGGFAVGDRNLITYSGTLTGDVAQFTLSEMPPGFSGQLIHDAANKAILLRTFVPPVSSITVPVTGIYRTATWPGVISGSVTDPNGIGIADVSLSLRKGSGEYFNGTNFSSMTEVWIPTSLNVLNWSYSIPVSSFGTDDAYTIRVRATDTGTNVENPPAQRAFTIDRIAPVVTVAALSTQSASPGLNGTVNDASATILVSVNGATVSAQNSGSAWSVAAGSLPGMVAGAYDVAVQATDPAGNIGTDTTTNELTIALPNISVSQVAPVTGSAAGGTVVTLTGTNLDLVTAVRFGANVSVLQSKSTTSVKILTPEHEAGDVAITVESLSNTVVLNNAFSYFNPPPSLVSVTPVRVSTNGGTLITVQGAGFLKGSIIQVNGKNASEIRFVSSKVLTARVPSNAPGPAAVTVVNPDNNAVSLPNAVTYDQPPQLSSVPQLTTSQVQAGSPVQVLFGFFDPEGGTVNYSVDWGDGSTPGLATIHTYANAGVYTITISASDGIGTTTHTLLVTVNAAPGGGGEPTPDGSALQIDALSGAVRFDLLGKDSLKVSGVFPALPAGTSFDGVDSVLTVGGATERILLSAKGKGKSASGTLTLRLKFLRNKLTRGQEYNGAPIPFSASVKGAFADEWLDEGLRPDGGASGVSAPFVVSLSLGATQAVSAATTNTAVRAGKSGKFSFKRAK